MCRSVPLYMSNWKLGTDTLRGLRQQAPYFETK
nr:MAG TPA: hypothetical protein [Caudoviricetes sp.]